jgi:hypothetical protein
MPNSTLFAPIRMLSSRRNNLKFVNNRRLVLIPPVNKPRMWEERVSNCYWSIYSGSCFHRKVATSAHMNCWWCLVELIGDFSIVCMSRRNVHSFVY